MTKTTKKLAAKIDEIDEAVDGRISAMEWQISEARKLAESAHNHIREHRKITEDVAREASKTRKHAQTNQETLVQHATELGRLRAADHDAVVLIRDERARITALEKHFGKAAADSNHDRQRLEQLEQFVSELHNRICDLEPKDVDPRQDPRQCPEEQSFYEPEPRKAPPEVMRQMGEAAATFGPCNTVQPEEQWVRTADLERLHKRAEAAEMARDQALEWQQRTQAAKQQARDEVDAAMAECRELRAQRDDWKDRAEAADETVERLEHALMDRTRQNQQLEKTIRDHQTSIERLHGYVDQKEREAARDSEWPSKLELGRILELLRYFGDDALQDRNGCWDGEEAERWAEARRFLAKFGRKFMPDQGCETGSDEAEDAEDAADDAETSESSWCSIEQPVDYDAIEGRPEIDDAEFGQKIRAMGERGRKPWARGLNPDPSKLELAAERDTFLNQSMELERERDDAKAEANRLKADILSRDCQISELQLRVQQYLSDETLRPKWLFHEVERLRGLLQEAEARAMQQLEHLNHTIQLQARMLGAAATADPVGYRTLVPAGEAYVPSEEAQRKAREAFDKYTESEETSDDDRPDGHDRDSGEAADCNGGTAAQREVDLGEVAGDADSQP